VTEGAGRRLVHVVRIASGATLAMVEQRASLGSCVPLGLSAGAPLVVAFFDESRGVLAARVDHARGGLRWSGAWASTPAVPTSSFDTTRGLGATFDDGTVAVLADGKASWSVIDRGHTSHRSDAEGDIVVWSRSGSAAGDVIRGSLGGGPPSTIVDHDVDAHVVAASPEKVVWIGTRGPRAHVGEYEHAQIFFSRRSAEGSLVAGPTLPATSGLSDLVSKGEWAATAGCSSRSHCELFVARLDRGTVARRAPSPGRVHRGVLAISETEVLLAESNVGTPPQRIEKLVRVKLASLR
jgi:hypothetical protein